MDALKKMIAGAFDFVGDFKEDPPTFLLLGLLMLVAAVWWVVFVFPISIPLCALKDWSNSKDKTLWKAYKDNFRGPVQ